MIELLFFLVIFCFGLIIGSFLNCVIFRLEKNQTFLKGKSYCPNCLHNLGFFDLVPLFSFLFLKASCRYCKKPISWQYPLIEAITGIIFLLIFAFNPVDFAINNSALIFSALLTLFYYWLIASFLIVILVYDLKYYLILNKVIYPVILISLAFNFWLLFLGEALTFKLSLLAGLTAGGFFFFLVAVSKGKWMGGGDIKLAFLMGIFLGWPNILVALFFAFFTGALVGIILIFLNKKTFKSEIPFGPFLVAGTFFAFFFGILSVDWYSQFFLI